MMKRHGVYALLLLSLIGGSAYSQENQLVTGTIVQRPAQQVVSDDTIPAINLGEEELDNIVDIRKQFEKQNKTYSAPLAPSTNLLRFLKKDELEISDEAMYWARLVRDASTIFDNTMTFRDTVIVNPLFMPIVFRGDYLPENLIFYNFDSLKERTPYDNLYRTDSIFKDLERNKQFEEMAYKYVQNNYPTYFRYSERDLPNEVIKPKFIKKNIYEDLPIKVEADANFEDVDAPARFIPERRYWISAFESAVQFSQNYVSENWYKGGSSNLNLFTKNNLKYDYKKDKVQVTNELEFKASVYTAPKDTLRNYKIGDDVFRIHSNVGYQAFNKWYYTFDAEFKTQFFTNYQENERIKQAAFLAPFSINFGLGMKYELEKQFTDKHKKIKFSTNLAPISYTYMYTTQEIDYSRHGFKKNEETGEFNNKLSQIGSTIRADLAFDFNRNVSWQSRLYFFTTYGDHTIGEFENTLVLAISRFFSTRIYFHLRYDDGVEKTEDNKSYFQLNELLSFGFNYKW